MEGGQTESIPGRRGRTPSAEDLASPRVIFRIDGSGERREVAPTPARSSERVLPERSRQVLSSAGFGARQAATRRNAMKTSAIGIAMAAVIVAGTAALAVDARQGRRTGMPMYITATEVTLKGEVTEVTTQTGRRGMSGIHVTLKGDAAPVDVHLGPAAYLEQRHFEVAKGDVIEVVGSKVTVAGAEAVLARTVKKGETVTVLRDENGVPKWARAGRGGW